MQKRYFLNRDKNKTYFAAITETTSCEWVMFHGNSFCCPCMYTKIARNRFQLFKETTFGEISGTTKKVTGSDVLL